MNIQRLQNYFSKELGWGWGYQARVCFDFLTDVAERSKGAVILDVGAGHQRYKPFFEDSIYLAQEHPEAGVKNKKIVSFDILCDVKHIPLKSESVDYVLSTSSLEHFEFPELFFPDAFRVLKPGGGFLYTCPLFMGNMKFLMTFKGQPATD